MLKEFLSWWLRQMLDLLPGQLSTRGEARVRGAIATLCGLPDAPIPTIELADRRTRQERPLGRFTLDAAGIPALRRALAGRRRVILRLPAGMLLERSVVLPLAAEREPEPVLRYELDRLTPFSGEEVFWTWRIERRDRQRGRLHLRVSLIPKAGLATLIAGLQQAGPAPAVIEAELPGGEWRSIAIAEPHPRAQRWRRRGLASAGLLCAVLALAVVALPFLRQELASRAIERRIAALTPRVDEVEALRNRLARDRAGADALAADEARLGNPLQVIAELTQLLPDDTYLTELTLQDRKLVLTGQSRAAAKLIGALSADSLVKNPAFAASVTRAEDSDVDLFSIHADLGN